MKKIKAKIKKEQEAFKLKEGQEVEVIFSHKDPVYNEDCFIIVGKDFWLPKRDLKFD